MTSPKTPLRHKQLQQVLKIPATPLLKPIGYGTGIAVYELERSPVSNMIRSPWAIKKLVQSGTKRSNFLDDRIRSEAEVLRKLNHPNIVGFRAFTQSSDGKNILAMEECTSCLGDLIMIRFEEELSQYPSHNILKVTSDVANALNYLHNTVCIMHCDIKSYNILIKGDFDICKLCDFGVSLPVVPVSGFVDKNKLDEEDQEYDGTPAWFAPEVVNYPPEITTKADIYALGLVIWEMIALLPPVDEEYAARLNEEVKGELENTYSENTYIRRRPPLPDIDLSDDYNHLLEVYFCCTNEDRNDRPTAKELVNILTEIGKIMQVK